jgi:Putative porin
MRRVTSGMILLGCAVLCASAEPVFAQTVEEQLAAMRQTLHRQQMEINTLKAQDSGGVDAADQHEAILKMIRSELKLTPLPESWGWIKRWRLYGDLRYRHEWINDGRLVDDRRDRNRHRVRLRVGALVDVNDEWNVGFQIATGNQNPTSTNETLEDWFRSEDVWWDLFYFQYEPKWASGLKVIGGKMKNPFYKVNKSDLIWDGDLRPEGLAVQYKTALSDDVTLYAAGGGFYLQEDIGGSTTDQSLWGAQVYAKMKLAEKSYVLAGISYYDYANVENQRLGPDGAVGNTNAGGYYLMDYNIVNPFVEVGLPVGKLPLKLYADFAVNASAQSSAAFSDNDFAWLIGAQLGKCKKPGSWQVRYDYRAVEPDSVIGVFSDSDSWGGGTNGSGHRISLGYQVAKNVQVAATYFCDEAPEYTRAADEEFYHRLQVDLKLKF